MSSMANFHGSQISQKLTISAATTAAVASMATSASLIQCFLLVLLASTRSLQPTGRSRAVRLRGDLTTGVLVPGIMVQCSGAGGLGHDTTSLLPLSASWIHGTPRLVSQGPGKPGKHRSLSTCLGKVVSPRPHGQAMTKSMVHNRIMCRCCRPRNVRVCMQQAAACCASLCMFRNLRFRRPLVHTSDPNPNRKAPKLPSSCFVFPGLWLSLEAMSVQQHRPEPQTRSHDVHFQSRRGLAARNWDSLSGSSNNTRPPTGVARYAGEKLRTVGEH